MTVRGDAGYNYFEDYLSRKQNILDEARRAKEAEAAAAAARANGLQCSDGLSWLDVGKAAFSDFSLGADDIEGPVGSVKDLSTKSLSELQAELKSVLGEYNSIDNLTKELDGLRKLEKKLPDLQKEVESATQAYEDGTKDVEEQRKAFDILHEKCGKLEKESTSLDKTINEKTQTNKGLNDQILSKGKTIENNESKIKEYDQIINGTGEGSVKGSIDNLKKQIKELPKDDNYEANKAQLEAKITAKQNTINDAKSKKKELEQTNKKLKQEVIKLDKQKTQNEKAIEDAKKKKIEVDRELEVQRKAETELKDEIEKKCENFSDLLDKKDKAIKEKEEAEQLVSQIPQLEERLSKAKEIQAHIDKLAPTPTPKPAPAPAPTPTPTPAPERPSAGKFGTGDDAQPNVINKIKYDDSANEQGYTFTKQNFKSEGWYSDKNRAKEKAYLAKMGDGALKSQNVGEFTELFIKSNYLSWGYSSPDKINKDKLAHSIQVANPSFFNSKGEMYGDVDKNRLNLPSEKGIKKYEK